MRRLLQLQAVILASFVWHAWAGSLPRPAAQRPLRGSDLANASQSWPSESDCKESRSSHKHFFSWLWKFPSKHGEDQRPLTLPGNPLNHSWIESFTAIGDSYAAGLGAGYAVAGHHGSESGSPCNHYSHGYPNILNTDGLLGANPKRVFQYLACSGAKTEQMRAEQIPQMQRSQLVTLSAGGNDANLAPILNACVYQWAPWFQPGCDEQLQATHDFINSAAYTSNLNSLVKEITAKLDGPRARIYWVGYPRFWDTRTTECDNVTWAFSWNLWNKQYLTQKLRTDMNGLIDNVNSKIQTICNSTEQCRYINTQLDIERTEGHFCQPGVDESYSIITGGAAANRPQTWFYEWGTTKDDDKFKLPDGKTAVARSGLPPARSADHVSAIKIESALAAVNRTNMHFSDIPKFNELNFEEAILFFVHAGLRNGSINSTIFEDPGTSGHDLKQQGFKVPTKYRRVFHLDKYAHSDIAVQILAAMDREEENMTTIQGMQTKQN